MFFLVHSFKFTCLILFLGTSLQRFIFGVELPVYLSRALRHPFPFDIFDFSRPLWCVLISFPLILHH
jgi:hypothetical protein